MTTNPYAPPVPSVQPFPVKRPFFKSGARILFLVFLLRLVCSFVFALGIGFLLPTIMSHGVEIPELADYEALTQRIMRAVFWGFVPVGAWVLTRSPAVQTVRKTLQIAHGTTGLALAAAAFMWLITLVWYFGSPFYSQIAIIAEILRISCTLALLLVVYRLATSQNRRRIRIISILAILLNILECVKDEILDANPSPSVPWWIVQIVFGLLVEAVFLATLWSARKLEDVPPEVPLTAKPQKPKRRSSRASRSESD